MKDGHKKIILGGLATGMITLTAPHLTRAATAIDESRNLFRQSSQTAGLVGANGENVSLITLVGSVIGGLISFIGVIFVIILVYAGFLYLTAAGNDQQTARAKSMITTGVVGMVIVLASYAIASFVVQSIVGATLNPTP